MPIRNRTEYDKKRRNTPACKERDRLSKIRNKEKRLFYGARARAAEKHLEFDITPDDIIIPDVCPVLGIPIIKDASCVRQDGSPTIDRIDSSKGYTKDNICVISNKANTIKSFGTIEDHYKIIDYMLRNRRGSCVTHSQPAHGLCIERMNCANTINEQATGKQ